MTGLLHLSNRTVIERCDERWMGHEDVSARKRLARITEGFWIIEWSAV